MAGQPEPHGLFPRVTLTPVVRLLLIGLVVFALLNTVLINWMGQNGLMEWLVADARALRGLQVHRLFTSLLLTSSVTYTHVLFSLLMLYFFGPSVEGRLGSRTFALLFFGAGVAGTLLSLAGGELGIDRAGGPFLGPNAAIEAIVVAWSLQNADAVFRLFFVVQLRGAWMKWISLALALLGLLYQTFGLEGRLAPLAGFAVGYLFGGSPSLVRSFWLKRKLNSLQTQQAKLRKDRPGAPSLRVVYGGLADELELDKDKKGGRKGPDKRTLN